MILYHYPLIYSSFRPFVHKKLISLLQRRHKSKIMVNLSGCTKIMFDSQLIHVIHNIHEKYIHIHFPWFSAKNELCTKLSTLSTKFSHIFPFISHGKTYGFLCSYLINPLFTPKNTGKTLDFSTSAKVEMQFLFCG